MTQAILSGLLQNWHFMRIFRAAIAVFAFFEAGRTGDALMYAAGGILGLQAIFNVGCCGAAGCATPSRKSVGQNTGDEVTYEEVR